MLHTQQIELSRVHTRSLVDILRAASLLAAATDSNVSVQVQGSAETRYGVPVVLNTPHILKETMLTDRRTFFHVILDGDTTWTRVRPVGDEWAYVVISFHGRQQQEQDVFLESENGMEREKVK